MSGWSRNVVLEPIEFDGDKVVFTVKRLTNDDVFTILEFYDREKGTLKFESAKDVSRAAAQLLPKYMVALEGLKDSDGAPIGRDEFASVCGEYYFHRLMGAVFAQLVSVSMLTTEDAKKSPSQPTRPSGESAAETPPLSAG